MVKLWDDCPERRSSNAWSKYLLFLCVGFVLTLLVLGCLYLWITSQEATNTTRTNEKCKHDLSEEVNGTIGENGYLNTSDGHVYEPEYFQVVNDVIRLCVCKLKPCIRKCCLKHQALEKSNCTSTTHSSFNPLTLKVYNGTIDKRVNVSVEHFHILHGVVCQYGKYMLNDTDEQDKNYLMLDGTLLYADQFLDATQYCLDSSTDDDYVHTVVCFPPSREEPEFTVYPLGMLTSIPFLFMTFLVYAIVPDLRNLHGISLMCYVFCLVIAYAFLSVIQLGKDAVGHNCCVVFAYIIQFSFLASFFWLNVMCFDIWWVFSGWRTIRGSVKEREYKKFIMYSVYAWGCPFIIFIISLVMDSWKIIPDHFIKPNFGVEKCWFKDNMANIVYFYLPIGILVLLNIIMFVTTAYRLKVHTKETQVLKGGDSKRHDENERQRLNLYIKLFIVMGINWSAELLSFLVGGPKYMWILTDICNTLQGVLIFLIFVWKRRILRLLNHKLCPKLQLVPATSTTSRSKVSPSRTTTTNISKMSNINSDNVCLKKLPVSDDSDAPP